ncbi:hypothetical protein [Sphingomonas sp. S2-65]|jgi:hypothetical protein|nr:hypothetical protein [Sphingomonas sp. S2-65]UYY59206.1 hypothetical protein LZ586_03660 [Sphingomonas sp. S2-65]
MDGNMGPNDPRARRGMGWIAALVLAIILAIFVGYNVYYAATAG